MVSRTAVLASSSTRANLAMVLGVSSTVLGVTSTVLGVTSTVLGVTSPVNGLEDRRAGVVVRVRKLGDGVGCNVNSARLVHLGREPLLLQLVIITVPCS
eukprot:1448227-Pyramimonas_sp.AAC.1